MPEMRMTNRLTKTTTKRVVKAFEQNGQSSHSARAATLPAIFNHCIDNRIPFVLTARPKFGYHMKVVK